MTRGLVLATLRLHRAQIVVTAAFLVVLLATAALHGSVSAGFIAGRDAQTCGPAGCGSLAHDVAQRFQLGGTLLGYLALLPAAIGAFWGAPLLGREFETGTTSFAWTQSVTRRSWVLTRIITLGLLVALGGLVMGLVVNQWLSVFSGFNLIDGTGADMSFAQVRGAGAMAWWLLGFAVGTASGALLRRTVPAMVVTVAIVVAATIARNLLVAAMPEAQLPIGLEPLRVVEILVLLSAAVLLAAASTWMTGRARG